MKFGQLMTKHLQENKENQMNYIQFNSLKQQLHLDSQTFINNLSDEIKKVELYFTNSDNKETLLTFCLFNLFAILKIINR